MDDEYYFDFDCDGQAGDVAPDDVAFFGLDGDGSAAADGSGDCAADGSGDVALHDVEFFDLDGDGSAAAGDGAVMPGPEQHERTAAPVGFRRGTPAWSQWMNKLRWDRHLSTQARVAEVGLKSAWNLAPIRHGYQVPDNSEDPRLGYSDRHHGNEILPAGVL